LRNPKRSILTELNEIPNNWVKTSIGETLIVVLGQSPASSSYNEEGNGEPFFQGKTEFGALYPTVRKWCTEPKKFAKKNSILVSVRAPVGPTNIAPFDCVIGRGLAALQPLADCNTKYFLYLIRNFEKQLAALGTGTTFEAISGDVLKNFQIPLAPVVQQNLIVEKIEELFSHIDAGVEGLKQAKAKLQQYRQSVLKDAVTGKLTEQWRELNADKLEPANILLERILDERLANWEAEQLKVFEEKGKTPKNDKWKDKYITPKEPQSLEWLPSGWTNTVTDQVFSFVTSGSRGWAKYYSEEGVLFLRVGNLFHYNVELDLRKLQRVSPPIGSEGSRTRVQEGDNLISITADVGMVGYVPENFEEAYINQHVALARPVVTTMGKYLSWLLSGDFAKEQFKALQKGATKAGLGLDDIRSINFGLPSLQEQQQIVFEIESRISGLEKLAKEIEDKIQHASKLKSSILADAFSGNLVDNIDTKETAEQLLNIIQAEKQSIEEKAKLAKKKPNARAKKMEKRPIIDVLKESNKALSVDELFEQAGFQKEVTPESIEEFYQELKIVAEAKYVEVFPILLDGKKQGDKFEYKEVKPNEA
jgi:type I restriction enzyme S subunit